MFLYLNTPLLFSNVFIEVICKWTDYVFYANFEKTMQLILLKSSWSLDSINITNWYLDWKWLKYGKFKFLYAKLSHRVLVI